MQEESPGTSRQARGPSNRQPPAPVNQRPDPGPGPSKPPTNGVRRANGAAKDSDGDNEHIHLHRPPPKSINQANIRKLKICCVLSCLCFIATLVASVYADSLAITTEAVHLLCDFATYVVAIWAMKMSQRRQTRRLSFGWYRIEVVTALITLMVTWMITGVLTYLAIQHIVESSYHINALIMLTAAVCLLVFNLLIALVIHSSCGSQGPQSATPSPDLSAELGIIPNPMSISESRRFIPGDNVSDLDPVNNFHLLQRPNRFVERRDSIATQIHLHIASLHILGDLFQSVLILVTSVIIYFHPKLQVLDPICTLIFSVCVLLISLMVMKDLILVFMNSTPTFLDFQSIIQVFYSIQGVKHVHNLRVWTLQPGRVALLVHLAIEPNAKYFVVLRQATSLIHNNFEIYDTTIQIEDYKPTMEDCQQCVLPAAGLFK